MAIKTYDDTNFVMIASAIRAKNGLATQYKPSEMSEAINALKMAKDVEPNNSASGLKVKFEDGADGEKYNSLVLNIPLLQDGTGDPSPTNKRAFVSYTKFEVYYSGADTSDYETYSLNHSILGGTLDLISGAEHFFSSSLMLVNYSDILTIYTDTNTGVSLFYLPWSTSFGDIYSEFLKTVEKQGSLSEAAANMPNNSIAGAKGAAVGTIGFFIRADSFSTVSDLIASVGLDKCYSTELMDDTTITSGLFTDVTELGVNNLWAIGYRQAVPYLNQDIPLEVSYKADPTLYANNLVYETVRDLLPQDTASGAIANFPDGSDGYPIVEGIFNIEPNQEGSGDPTPSNVRPISGFTGMDITRRGKNFLDQDTLYLGYKQADGSFLGLGSDFNTIYFYIPEELVGKQLTFSALIKIPTGSTISNPRVSARVDNANVNGNAITSSDYTLSSVTFTPTSTSDRLRITYGSNGSSEVQFKDVMLELGSTATTFEAYQTPTIKSINWTDSAGTVYGGELNLTTGVLTVTFKMVNLFGRDWDSGSPNQDGYIRFVNHTSIGDKANGYNLYCNILPVKSTLIPSSPTTIGISGYSGNANIYMAISSDMLTGDLSTNEGRNTAFKDWISANGLQILYELATPITYQLTPQELTTLLGTNNIWSNTGDSEIKYRADIALYIDKIINS